MNSNQDDFENIHKGTESFTNEEGTNQLLEKGDNHPNNVVRKEDNYVHVPYAGFWMRFWAYLLDLLVIGSITRIIANPIFKLLDVTLKDPSMFAPISIVSALLFYGYFVFMTKFLGQTLGKMVFGIKVISLEGKSLSWSTILFREWIGRFISGTILILYIVVGFMPKKQGIHDLFADTTVIHERSFNKS